MLEQKMTQDPFPDDADPIPIHLSVSLEEVSCDGRCEVCGGINGVRLVSSMTCYHHEPGKPDPNKPHFLCSDCEKYHVEYWEGMWKEYQSGLL
jgi:hypothetical protein